MGANRTPSSRARLTAWVKVLERKPRAKTAYPRQAMEPSRADARWASASSRIAPSTLLCLDRGVEEGFVLSLLVAIHHHDQDQADHGVASVPAGRRAHRPTVSLHDGQALMSRARGNPQPAQT